MDCWRGTVNKAVGHKSELLRKRHNQFLGKDTQDFFQH